jgi:hypothetical protein
MVIGETVAVEIIDSTIIETIAIITIKEEKNIVGLESAI